jgi:hypothetical protein
VLDHFGSKESDVIEWLDESEPSPAIQRDKWFDVKDSKPGIESEDDAYVLIYGCKFGDIKKDIAGHHMIGSWNGKFWEDGSGKDIENNPDYWIVTHWQFLTHPTSWQAAQPSPEKGEELICVSVTNPPTIPTGE